jgi:molybdate transport system permease protein
MTLFDIAALSVSIFYGVAILVLLLANFTVLDTADLVSAWRHPDIRHAAWLTLWTSATSAALSLFFAVPIGYSLSRLRFPGRSLLDTLVDSPIVLPNLVIGVMLLVFFRTPFGQAIQRIGPNFVYAPAGIVLAQFVCVCPYAVRAVKGAFDGIDQRIEDVSRTLGWTAAQTFLRVTLPLVRNGIVAGGVIAWAMAMGLYGPMMVFAGTTRRRTEVLATSVYLELSIGRIGVALAVSLSLAVFAMGALWLFKRFVGEKELW